MLYIYIYIYIYIERERERERANFLKYGDLGIYIVSLKVSIPINWLINPKTFM